VSEQIHSFAVGINTCYVIQQQGAIIFDGGFPGTLGIFKKALDKMSLEPEEIGLIVLSHGHFDHVGAASELREHTGARVALHHTDKQQLERDIRTMPPGVTTWGKISKVLFKPMLAVLQYKIPQVDVLLGDEEVSLAEYGIAGRIIHTPGHSPGSVSVVLDTGDAFVGCMAQSGPPFRLKPNLPIYAEDVDALKESWRALIAAGASTIYPGHGRPFPVDAIRAAL
jgi:glyoxylase-like metal-dependent hydrolase (beta-lactamase superfamily II)